MKAFKNNKITITAVVLCLLMIMSSIAASPVYSADVDVAYATTLADELKALGLFEGTSKGYELERPATRVEGMVMLLRLMKKENRAVSDANTHPFVDVPVWANHYIGFAYKNGLTSGTSETTFGESNLNSAQYITLVLRALGYSERLNRFTWSNPYDFAQSIGLVKENEYALNSKFLRADVVILSHRALDVKLAGENRTLREKISEPVINDGLLEGWVNTGGNPFLADGTPNYAIGTMENIYAGVKYRDRVKYTDDKFQLEFIENTKRLNTRLIIYLMGYYNGNMFEGNLNLTYRGTLTDLNDQYYLHLTWWRSVREEINTEMFDAFTLNAHLETFDFFLMDKEFAYALWSAIDRMGVEKKVEFEKFGFEVEKIGEKRFYATMNGQTVEIDHSVNGVLIIFK